MLADHSKHFGIRSIGVKSKILAIRIRINVCFNVLGRKGGEAELPIEYPTNYEACFFNAGH